MKTLQIPPLAEGETYIGPIGDQTGEVYHVILLLGDNDDSDWQSAMDWAKSIGGDLPTRIEQSMLFANSRSEFHKDWYWSNTTVDGYDAYAWCQDFGHGDQFDHRKSIDDCRARAVRRLPI